jgi:hypothetical protein
MSRRVPRHALLGALAAAIATVTSAPAAGAFYPRIDPGDFFIATVNGSSGQHAPVTIFMACAGPVYPGETGHPLGSQTVGVKRVPPPPPGTATLGYTGDRGTSIGAFFGPPPPGARTGSSYVSFQVYRMKAIPIDLELPCSGSGQVTFVPLPLLPPARSIAVPVRFVGQP